MNKVIKTEQSPLPDFRKRSPELENILEKPMPFIARWGIILVILLALTLASIFYASVFKETMP